MLLIYSEVELKAEVVVDRRNLHSQERLAVHSRPRFGDARNIKEFITKSNLCT